MRAAAKRQLVTDEAASPNGEDKGAVRGATHSRRPFTERYADRRNAYKAKAAATKNGSRGKSEEAPVSRVRRTETRRSLFFSSRGKCDARSAYATARFGIKG